ncbi:hypothetical protein AYJ54_08005 [Bradyrhizobium centrolobii]|uniref:Uncharacterized protein n=1 Tax=Bradyrhizobium centrolobii TaxID=1505087 RepID=A0A176YYD7_9BRAD|nr:hypothetical protein [Bradyrhizobium centrolobii]OAF11793.1 hypothetical protein AYJ54_08005 [Bradyrhizobium centrolobii]
MLALELPHWLMIVGSGLVIAGLIGLGLSRNKQVDSDPVALPGDLTTWRAEEADVSAAAVPDLRR